MSTAFETEAELNLHQLLAAVISKYAPGTCAEISRTDYDRRYELKLTDGASGKVILSNKITPEWGPEGSGAEE
ncbi:hypothetical protein [Arthrobacter sp. B2a2-09]|uniref:hypothetical protein n=1 Tax=Arthrobacter sp. B2a2-09 TaxID=2952822 RepID=UPI0022CDA641|nr:hypothetical protein [Arthrobacter sp. B2a2-09]